MTSQSPHEFSEEYPADSNIPNLEEFLEQGLNTSLEKYSDSQDKHLEAIVTALEEKLKGTSDSQTKENLVQSRSEYVSAFYKVMNEITAAENDVNEQIKLIAGVMTNEHTNRIAYFKAIAEGYEDDIEAYHGEELVNNLRNQLIEEDDTIDDIIESIAETLEQELAEAYEILSEKYIEQRLSEDNDEPHHEVHEVFITEAETRKELVQRNLSSIARTALGVAGGIIIANFVSKRFDK